MVNLLLCARPEALILVRSNFPLCDIFFCIFRICDSSNRFQIPRRDSGSLFLTMAALIALLTTRPFILTDSKVSVMERRSSSTLSRRKEAAGVLRASVDLTEPQFRGRLAGGHRTTTITRAVANMAETKGEEADTTVTELLK